MGVTKPIFSVPLFSTFPLLSKQTLAIEYHVYIWQVSPQLSCGDTCQIWMWFRESNRYFCKIENFAYGEINERSFSNPHPISVIIMAGTDFVGYRILATDMENIIDEICFSCVAESKTVPVVVANDTHWTILNNTATGLETCKNTGWLKVGPFLTPVNKHRPGVWNIGCVGSEVARQLHIWYYLTEYHFRTYTHSYRYQCLELSSGKFPCAHEWYCGCLLSKLRSNDANEH